MCTLRFCFSATILDFTLRNPWSFQLLLSSGKPDQRPAFRPLHTQPHSTMSE